MTTPATPLPAAPALSNRQRHNLRRWARGNKTMKVREELELRDLGLIQWISGPVQGGGYAAFPVLSEAGIAAIGNCTVRKPTIRSVATS